jgi:hypothetical protein
MGIGLRVSPCSINVDGPPQAGQFGARSKSGKLAGVSSAVILPALHLRRVRLVVRTQPSQGWCTGSTPVRAASLDDTRKSGPEKAK